MASPLTPFELERLTKIEKNRQFLESLGVDNAVRELERAVSAKKVRRTSAPRNPIAVVPIGPTRRSSRVGGKAAVVYKELTEREVHLIEGPEPKRGTLKSSSARQPRASSGPEQYTEEHEKALGECKEEWVLFQDGYVPGEGTRVYDMVQGKTCHQCRQKTLGKRTWCNSCETLNGQFCGDCLYMRYGENVLEANANPEWKCPSCRDLCNCSICRNRKGWGPTGQLYRTAINQGYKSVAHYLVATRKAPPATEPPPSAEDQTQSAVEPPLETPQRTPATPSCASPSATVSQGRSADVIGSESHAPLASPSCGTSKPPATALLLSSCSGITACGPRVACPSPESVNRGAETATTKSRLEQRSPSPISKITTEGPSASPVTPDVEGPAFADVVFVGSVDIGARKEQPDRSGGVSSCESGLSSEGAPTPLKREMVERKFRSLQEIVSELTGETRSAKRRRGISTRGSCKRAVSFE